jgi:hypothetical protein
LKVNRCSHRVDINSDDLLHRVGKCSRQTAPDARIATSGDKVAATQA